MQSGTLVAHLDVDAFYVSVECVRAPELAGKPVVVAGTGPRAVVTTASYEARRFGVGSAMPAARARRLCPQAIFLKPDFPAYREVSARLMGILRGHVDRVEVVGLDEAYLDLSGLAFPHATMRRAVSEIRAATGLGCSVGIGPNKLVAKVASDAEKPAGFVVLSREEACTRFAGAPPRLLPGIGPKTAAKLEGMGIATIAALRAMAPEVLVERFGENHGRELARRAEFRGATELSERRKVLSASRERTFDVDVTDSDALVRCLEEMTGELCGSLQAKGRAGRTVAIKVRLADFTTVTRARTLPAPANAAETVGRVARELLREYAPPRPVRLLGVRVAGLTAGDAPPAAREADGRREGARAGQLVLPV
ncbi:MAG: DNA polymerase IV [Acidobacteriota bacterium]|nr:DNA polymerase IV [Acidobacteriota bacterium]